MEFNPPPLHVPGREGDILQDPSPEAVYTAWTGAGASQQRQVLGGGYLQQPQLEHLCGQNHSQRKQDTQIN